jgi:raffinose/stachyose/melibiose transport system permease protein
MKKHFGEKIEPWLFILPALAVFIFVVILPVVWSVGYSFFDWNGITKMKPVGINNYIRMIHDKNFITSFFNNLFFMIAGCSTQIGVGLIMAIIFSSITKGSNIGRVIFFIPCIMSSAAICKIFDRFLALEPKGIYASLMGLLGITPIVLLSDPKMSLLIVTLVDAYKYCGIYMVIFYSALAALPFDVIEAAIIDGCSWFQQQWYIKLPMIRNMFIVILVMLINGLLKGFDVSMILTRGGPGYSSELVATYMYKIAFNSTRFGYGSALSVFLLFESLLVVGVLRYLQIRIAKNNEG